MNMKPTNPHLKNFKKFIYTKLRKSAITIDTPKEKEMPKQKFADLRFKLDREKERYNSHPNSAWKKQAAGSGKNTR